MLGYSVTEVKKYKSVGADLGLVCEEPSGQALQSAANSKLCKRVKLENTTRKREEGKVKEHT